MRSYAGLALACALAGAPAAARPFTVEDLLGLQDFGRAAFSPDGRWLIAERYGRFEDAPSFDHEFLSHQTTSRLWVTDLRTGAAPRLLLPEDPRAGDTLGAFSPDGSRVVVFRLKDRRREMGVVTLATGATVWSGLAAEPDFWAANARWRNDREVVVLAREPGAPSALLGSGWQTQARTTAAWDAASHGGYSGVVLGAGRYLPLNPPPAEAALAVFDVMSGKARVVARGAFADMLVSPDGRRVALARDAEPVQPGAQDVVSLASPPRRRRLTLVDLVTGQATTPCPACDLAPGIWSWAPEGGSLVAAARDRPAYDAVYRYWRLDMSGTAKALEPDLAVALVAAGGERRPTGQVAWLGQDPVILARPDGATRSDWWRLNGRGKVNLTAGLEPPQGRALAADKEGVLVVSASGLIRLPPHGPARVIAAPGPSLLGPRPLRGDPVTLLLATKDGQAWLTDTQGRRHRAAPPPDGAELLTFAADGQAVGIARDRHGVGTLTLYRPDAPARALLTINAPLGQIEFGTPVAIQHAGATGEPLTSWLFLPPQARPDTELPLIVVPYPGDRRDRPPAAMGPGLVLMETNVQLMLAQGYAVLLPSLPLAVDQEPGPGLAEAILRAVDAAHAQHPVVSAERIALWGQSFGGWGTLMAGSQSPRFKALIATAPATDLIAFHGGLRPATLAVPEAALTLTGMGGWAEAGQGRMGAPPWDAVERYARNSPRLQADKITAPVMLVYGDLDFDPVQATAMFSGLAREGKDVQLLYYRGEQHVVMTPANVRDLYRRAFAFLNEALSPVPPLTAAGGARSAPPASPAITPSQ